LEKRALSMLNYFDVIFSDGLFMLIRIVL